MQANNRDAGSLWDMVSAIYHIQEFTTIALFARMRCGHSVQNYELINSLLVGVYPMRSGTAII